MSAGETLAGTRPTNLGIQSRVDKGHMARQAHMAPIVDIQVSRVDKLVLALAS